MIPRRFDSRDRLRGTPVLFQIPRITARRSSRAGWTPSRDRVVLFGPFFPHFSAKIPPQFRHLNWPRLNLCGKKNKFNFYNI